jgi:hypothetical protein
VGSHIKPKTINHCTNPARKANAMKCLSVLAPLGIQSITSKTDGVPAFAKDKWVSDFLPTLYAHLASVKKPWQPYNVGSDLVKTLQFMADKVYPGLGYTITLGDGIYTMVCTAIAKLHRT